MRHKWSAKTYRCETCDTHFHSIDHDLPCPGHKPMQAAQFDEQLDPDNVPKIYSKVEAFGDLPLKRWRAGVDRYRPAKER